MKILVDNKIKCGVYKIRNIVNDKFYIGSTTGKFKNRCIAHRCSLRYNRHRNKHLQNSWNKYGENNFEFSHVELCDSSQTFEREQFYIDTLKPKFNIIQFVNRGVLGYKHTDEAKKKISDAFAGKNHPAYSGEYVFYHKNIGMVILGSAEFSQTYGFPKSAACKLKNEEINQYKGWIYLEGWSENFSFPTDIEKIYEEKIDARPYYAFYHKIHGSYLGHIKEFCDRYKVKRMNIKRLIKSINGECSVNGWISFGKRNKNFVFPSNVDDIYNHTTEKNNRIKMLKNKKSTFININGIKFQGSAEEFSKNYNLHLRCCIRLVQGGRKTYRGWKIL